MEGGGMNAISPVRQTGRKNLQVLTLALGGEIFAVAASKVREILDLVPVTEVPGSQAFLNGLINVRGKVVPLLDLRLLLGLDHSAATIDSRMIVVELPISGVPTIVGLRADKVYEMTDLGADSMEDPPQIGMRVRSNFVHCVGKRGAEFLIVLHLDAIFAAILANDVSLPTIRAPRGVEPSVAASA